MNYVRIDRTELPVEEHKAAEFIEHNLLTLGLNAQDFRHSVGLYLFAHDQKAAAQTTNEASQMIAWIRIAGRNGSIAAYAFAMVMELINKTNAPTIWSKADMAAREAATKLFATEFPSIAGVRNSTTHPGQLAGHPKQREQHSLNQPLMWGSAYFGEGAFLTDSMNAFDDALLFGASYKGGFVEYELSMRKADALDSAALDYGRAFSPLKNAAIAF